MMLSVSRAKDRTIMVRRVAELARSLGAQVDIEPAPLSKRGTWVNIRAARGLRITVDIDGDDRQQRPGVWVLSWNTSTDVDTCLADRFGGSVNQHHFGKATYIGEGFDGPRGLLGQLEHGLRMAQDGSAFDDEREHAAIAKAGETATERSERWAKWFVEDKTATEMST